MSHESLIILRDMFVITLHESLLLEAVDADEVAAVSPSPAVLALLPGLLPAEGDLQHLVTHPRHGVLIPVPRPSATSLAAGWRGGQRVPAVQVSHGVRFAHEGHLVGAGRVLPLASVHVHEGTVLRLSPVRLTIIPVLVCIRILVVIPLPITLVTPVQRGSFQRVLKYSM